MLVPAIAKREVQLLLCCARTELPPELADRARFLARQVLGWDQVLDMARLNGVVPLLHRSLMGSCADAVPAATRNQLANLYRVSAMRSLAMTAELLRLLELLDAQGIQAVPFKGPALGASAYGDATLREFYDLDVLVRRRDVRRARELLLSQGYLTREQARGIKDCSPTKKHWYLEHGRCGTGFDLHWRLTPRYFASPVDGDALWARLGRACVVGTEVEALSPEDTLLALCAHGSTACWSRLLLVCDVAQHISANPQLDWAAVGQRASQSGSLRRLLLGLLLARSLLGTELPPQVSAWIAADRKVTQLAVQAAHRMLSMQRQALGHVESVFVHLHTMERVRDKMLYCLGLVHESVTPNSTDESAVPLPRFLHLLYYLVHPVRLAVTYGPSALKHFLKRPS